MSNLRQTMGAFVGVALPKVSAGGLQLLTNLLLAASLGPAQFGALSVCITLILLLDAVLGSAVDMGVLRLTTGQSESRSINAVHKTALSAKVLGAGILGSLLLLLASPASSILLHDPAQSGLIRLSVVSVFGLLLLRSVQTYFQVAGRFSFYGMADLLHSFAKFGGIGILLAAREATATLVLVLYALGPLAVALMFLCTLCRPIAAAPFQSEVLRKLSGLVKWYFLASAAGSVTSRMDIFLVSAVAGPDQAGIFSAAQVMIVGFSLVGGYLGVVFAPRIIPLWKSGRFAAVYSRFQLWTFLACVCICIAALFIAEPLVAFILPDSFQGTVGVMLLLLPSALAALINFPWTVSFLLFTHPILLVVLDAVALPVLIILYWTCIHFQGASGAAVVTTTYALLKTAILQIVGWRTLRQGEAFVEGNLLDCGVAG